MISTRLLTESDQSWKEESLQRAWGSTSVARKGELVDAAPLEGYLTLDDGVPIGLLTLAQRNDGLEVVTLHAEVEGVGTGQALMDAAYQHAQQLNAPRLWLVTTNDNIRALHFYQRWGMDLAALYRDGVALSRQAKPSIPHVGANGLPIRHELEFELVMRA